MLKLPGATDSGLGAAVREGHVLADLGRMSSQIDIKAVKQVRASLAHLTLGRIQGHYSSEFGKQ
jgi:hypothetical protein